MKQCYLFLLALLVAHSPLQAAPPLDLSSMEDLAIQENGRSKPMYVFAVESLKSLYGKAEWKEEAGTRIPALEVVMDLAFNPKDWVDRKLIRVDHLDLKKELGLGREEKYFSYGELAKSVRLQQLLDEVLKKRKSGSKEKLDPLHEAARGAGSKMELFERLAGGRAWNLVPHPHDPLNGAWVNFPDAGKYYSEQQIAPALESFKGMATAYSEGNQDGFNASLVKLKEDLRALSPGVYPKEAMLSLENTYLQQHPFNLAKICYIFLIFVLALTAFKWQSQGYRVAWCFAALGFLFQVSGFVARILISGRAPVTNMYETVIWLGFGVMFFALIFEAIYRCRYFFMGAAPVSVISLILADSLPAVLNSAINPLVPVLRHNFWLSTHVLSITSSYAALGLALGVGHLILILVLLKKPVPAVLYQYLYRAIQVGVLLIGVGTILGGVWANYSWGRFWDWDPKETWALIAFLSYLAILHGRLAGWWGGFGLAVGSVLGFLSVLMAWYGVNFVLGQGLHSYGFGAGGLEYVTGFVILELAFVAAAAWVHRKPSGSKVRV